MKQLICILSIFFVAAQLAADDSDIFIDVSAQSSLKNYSWLNRPIVVFADNPGDISFKRQVAMLMANIEDLRERDVVVLTDTSPELKSTLRQRFRPRGFSFILIGKDGQIKLRKPIPWDVRSISRVIDKMPIRQQEIKSKN